MKVSRGWVAALLLGAGLHANAVAQAEWPSVGDPATVSRSAGRWLWADLVSTDTSRSAEFYGKVFGWTFRPVASADGTAGYMTILADGRPIGGIVPARGRTERGARWIGLASGDPKTMAARAQERGGAVATAPVVLPGAANSRRYAIRPEPISLSFVRSGVTRAITSGATTSGFGSNSGPTTRGRWSTFTGMCSATPSALPRAGPTPTSSRPEGARALA